MSDFTDRMNAFVSQMNGPVLYAVLAILALWALRANWFEGDHKGMVRLIKIVILGLAVVSFIATLTGYDQFTILNLVGQVLLILIYVIAWLFNGLGGALMDLVRPYMTLWRP